jgi:hypothetical protein
MASMLLVKRVMHRIWRMKLAVLIACLGSILIVAPLTAQAGPVDFFRHLFHHKKPPQVQHFRQTYYRLQVQAGIQITPPVQTRKYDFQEHPAF